MPKSKFVLLAFFAAFLSAVAFLSAGELSFYGQTDKNPLEYAAGETMTFTVSLLEDGAAVSGKTLRWTRRGDDGKTETGEAISSADAPLEIKTSLDVPGFVWIQVGVLGDNGKLLGGDGHSFNGGAGVRLDEVKGFPEPEDFDAFWAKQKERLAAVPMVEHRVPVDSGKEGVECFDVKVDCLGQPVSGYLCLPKEAKEKSLPAILEVHGYSVRSANKSVDRGSNALVFNVNAHGIENGREPAYYENLNKTTLAAYGLKAETNQTPEESYWNGMALRVMRALEYLKSRPEWDGKTLCVCGGSQGGFQTLLAAGLDSDVTLAQPTIPWMCDLSGYAEQGRVRQLFAPEWTPALGYYDGANHAKRIKCRVEIYAGLGDYVCPPTGQMVLYNNISAPVKLTFSQGRTHGYEMKNSIQYSLEK